MAFSSSSKSNDCVLTAISNLLGIAYEDVSAARDLVPGAIVLHNKTKCLGGTISYKIPAILEILGYKVVHETKGVRPAINNSCLFRFTAGPRSKAGHLVACIDGIAFESNGHTWDTRTRRMWNMSCFYLRPIV